MKTMCEIKYEWHTNRLKKQRNDSLKTRYTYKNTKEKRKRTFYRCSDLSKRWGKTMSWLCVPYNVLSVADDCLKSERVQEQPAAMLSKQTLHGEVGCNAMHCNESKCTVRKMDCTTKTKYYAWKWWYQHTTNMYIFYYYFFSKAYRCFIRTFSNHKNVCPWRSNTFQILHIFSWLFTK